VTQQQVDITALRGLVEQLESLIDYTESLKTGASGFAYMLPAEWQGPAMSEFLGSFQTWEAGAATLTEQARDMHSVAKAALDAYEKAVESLDTSWSKFQSAVGA
jgi:uncharacterized protein YukE